MPSVSWSTVGNRIALRSLENAIVSDAPAHAYLFCGPDSVGKLHAAVEFAAALNCAGDSRPCRVCRSCTDTFDGRHPDVAVVTIRSFCDETEHGDHAESREIRICQVRRLERVLLLTPYGGGRRIAILDAAHTFRTEAANAFLKTLEEPPEGTVIILVTDREDLLPETVVSRCQRVAFQRVDRRTLVDALLARGANEAAADSIGALANGRVGWAIRALEDDALMGEHAAALGTAVRLAHAGRSERFAWARGSDQRPVAFRERYQRELDTWEGWWRDILSVGAGAVGGLTNGDRLSVLEEESKLYAPAAVVAFLQSLANTRAIFKENVDPQLVVENLMLDLPRPMSAGVGPART